MTTAHTLRKGSRVTIIGSRHMLLTPDFPGWGTPDYADYLVPSTDFAGVEATVTSVESHGSNPWTRYSIRTADGYRASGMCLGTDIKA